jgi:phospholipid transport system substrate-binding protein
MFRPSLSLSKILLLSRIRDRFRSSLGMPAAHHGPADTVRLGIEQLAKALGQGRGAGTGGRPEDLHRISSRLFDLPWMAQEALGRHWLTRSVEEQVEFTHLIETLLLRTLGPKLRVGKRFVYGGPITEGHLTRIRSGIVPTRGAPIVIGYSLRPLGSRWAITDLTMDGRSFMERYREQLHLAIEETSYEDVLWKLRVKVLEASIRI